jgi:acetyl-CoA carboxylase biotin carboxyl carrier protein
MSTNVIKAHITGTVWKIEVKVGDKIDVGTTVVILESMKMEMPVESDEEGEVAEIHVAEGQSVVEDAPLVTLKLLTPQQPRPLTPRGRRAAAHGLRSPGVAPVAIIPSRRTSTGCA